jgi:hypothetical protein
MLCGLIIMGGLAALYGLHRLGLWLEKRGVIYGVAAPVRTPYMGQVRKP